MKLYELVQDNEAMSELKDYFDKVLREEAIKKVFDTGEAYDVKQAKEIIDSAFENIDNQFGKKVEPKKPINEAR